MDRQKDNAHRLAYALRDCASRRDIVAKLAQAMNYHPQQLAEDMRDISRYLNRLEEDIEEFDY